MQEHKELIERIVKIALSEKKQIPENLPQFFYENHGVYIRVLKNGVIEREGGNIYTIMPLAKTIISTMENFEPFNEVDVEVSVIKEIIPVVAKEQITQNHGIFIQYGPYNAVLLPKELEGEIEERLTALCQKANIHEDAWKEGGAQLFMFEPETVVIKI
ncbi:MAG: AMMECR1 domain-containing protein [Candidatus Aenigmarchaeota archaeon]|nr:AMMECR1 domain-containing protein [Candidatus Aenigmarchaeota archaeon]